MKTKTNPETDLLFQLTEESRGMGRIMAVIAFRESRFVGRAVTEAPLTDTGDSNGPSNQGDPA